MNSAFSDVCQGCQRVVVDCLCLALPLIGWTMPDPHKTHCEDCEKRLIDCMCRTFPVEHGWVIVMSDCPWCAVDLGPHKHKLKPDGQIGIVIAPLNGDRRPLQDIYMDEGL